MYDDIVAFAELGRFMDQKLKNYSSGMQVRLAFSIAIRAKSDVLLLDEVLAVGDEAFQRKCLDIFEEYKKQKQTVILVTHDMETVRRFCTRAMLLDSGEIRVIGKPVEVAEAYRELNQEEIGKGLEKENSNQTKSNLSIRVLDVHHKPKTSFITGDTMIVEISWPKNDKALNAGVAIMKNTGEFVFGSNTIKGDTKPKNGKIEFKVTLDLGTDRYYIMAGTFGDAAHKTVEFVANGPGFMVHRRVEDTDHGLANLDYNWITE